MRLMHYHVDVFLRQENLIFLPFLFLFIFVFRMSCDNTAVDLVNHGAQLVYVEPSAHSIEDLKENDFNYEFCCKHFGKGNLLFNQQFYSVNPTFSVLFKLICKIIKFDPEQFQLSELHVAL